MTVNVLLFLVGGMPTNLRCAARNEINTQALKKYSQLEITSLLTRQCSSHFIENVASVCMHGFMVKLKFDDRIFFVSVYVFSKGQQQYSV